MHASQDSIPDSESSPLSWDDLSTIVSDRGYLPVDLANGPTNAQSRLRLFG